MFGFDFVNGGEVFVSFLCLTFWKSRLEIELLGTALWFCFCSMS